MNLRCVFHVSPTSGVQPKAERGERLPNGEAPVDAIEVQAKPRGRSFETWSRARGWASED